MTMSFENPYQNINNKKMEEKKTEEAGITEIKVETKTETETKEEEEKFEKIRNDVENWTTLVGVDKENAGFVSEKLDPPELKEKMYSILEPTLDKILQSLEIQPDLNSAEKIRETKDAAEKTKYQKEFLDNTMKSFKKVSFKKWSFFPSQIQETKGFNCSGSALLMGRLLNKSGIETYYCAPPGHSVNIAKLADGSLFYLDSRINIQTPEDTEKNIVSIRKETAKEEEKEGIKILKINQPDIEYEIIPILSQKDSLAAMLDNFGSLKETEMEARTEKNKKEKDEEAVETYNRFKPSLDKIDFNEMKEKLYPGLKKYQASEEFKNEEERINKTRNIDESLKKNREENFDKLDPETQKKILQELQDNSGVAEKIIKGEKLSEEPKLSQETLKTLTGIRNSIEPLKRYNPDEAEKKSQEIIKSLKNFHSNRS